MFTPPDNQEGVGGQVVTESGETDQSEDVAAEDIHTMPSKFLNPSTAPKRRGRAKWIILGVVLVLVLGGVIYSVIAFLGNQAPLPSENTPLAQETEQETGPGEQVNQNANLNQSVDTASGRDLVKLADISAIRTALALYFKTYQVFPNTLNSLLGDFLAQLPQDPLEQANYDYQAVSQQQDYRLAFSLESESGWGILILPEGDYYASVEGIFPAADQQTPESQEANQNTNSSTPQTAPPVVGSNPSLGLDSDGDQLTDIEENVYQTNSTLADTDGDGYTDATEILNFYDPLDPEGRLVNSGLTELYTNPSYNYSVVYPEAWVVRSLTANNTEAIFTSNTGEFVEVI